MANLLYAPGSRMGRGWLISQTGEERSIKSVFIMGISIAESTDVFHVPFSSFNSDGTPKTAMSTSKPIPSGSRCCPLVSGGLKCSPF